MCFKMPVFILQASRKLYYERARKNYYGWLMVEWKERDNFFLHFVLQNHHPKECVHYENNSNKT